MEFKKFTIETYKIPSPDEFIAMFKIVCTNGTNTRIDWAIFDDQDKAYEGVIYNTVLTSNLYFSVKLNVRCKYFVLIREVDQSNNVISRTWEFIHGKDMCNNNDEYMLSVHSDNGWITTTSTTATTIENKIFPKIEYPYPVEKQYCTGVVDITNTQYSSCYQELDELIKQLEMMPIGNDEIEEKEEWEIELDKLIEDLNRPLVKNKIFDNKQSSNLSLIENYLGEKYVDSQLIFDIMIPIPIPPPLPIPPIKLNRYDFTNCHSFKEELKLVRNKVMGRKNDDYEYNEHRPSWLFSIFR